jgi:hypothetical protein
MEPLSHSTDVDGIGTKNSRLERKIVLIILTLRNDETISIVEDADVWFDIFWKRLQNGGHSP